MSLCEKCSFDALARFRLELLFNAVKGFETRWEEFQEKREISGFFKLQEFFKNKIVN